MVPDSMDPTRRRDAPSDASLRPRTSTVRFRAEDAAGAACGGQEVSLASVVDLHQQRQLLIFRSRCISEASSQVRGLSVRSPFLQKLEGLSDLGTGESRRESNIIDGTRASPSATSIVPELASGSLTISPLKRVR